MKKLRPNDISVMRTAIGLYSQPLGVQSFAVMVSEDKSEPKTEEERLTRDLLHRLEYGFTDEFSLSEDEVKFVTDALRQLIFRDNESLRYEKRPKCRSECEKEIRAAAVCIARIA